jgi:hypothetical protein
MRITSIFSHSAQAIAEGALVALLVVGLMAGTAFAGKPSRGGTTGTGTCSATPSPVDVGADYTLVGRGLGAYAIVNVLIADSMGTTSWNLQADASGMTSVTWHSYASGTSRATFQQNKRHGFATVASCSFMVN